MQKVIIIRGCVASGKSTIAKIYRNSKNKTAWLKIDNFKDLFDTFDLPIRPFVHGAANSVLEYLLNEGFSVVMEGVFQNPDFVYQARDIVKKHNIACKIFQTKVSLHTLQARDRKREGVPEGHRPPLGDEAIAKIYKAIEKNPLNDAIRLDTEHMTLEETIQFIDQQFRTG